MSVQIFAEAELDIEVPRQFFTPPPKVDSQVVVLRTRNNPLITPEDQRDFFRIVKAGFSAKRKKLRSSLSGGLGIDKIVAEELLKNAGISPDARAEDLAIEDWKRLLKSGVYDNCSSGDIIYIMTKKHAYITTAIPYVTACHTLGMLWIICWQTCGRVIPDRTGMKFVFKLAWMSMAIKLLPKLPVRIKLLKNTSTKRISILRR